MSLISLFAVGLSLYVSPHSSANHCALIKKYMELLSSCCFYTTKQELLVIDRQFNTSARPYGIVHLDPF